MYDQCLSSDELFALNVFVGGFLKALGCDTSILLVSAETVSAEALAGCQFHWGFHVEIPSDKWDSLMLSQFLY